jgi:predicted CXXCH cytochrome family protein
MRFCLLTMALLPLLASGAEAVKDSCFDCHGVMEGTSAVFKDDVHYHNTISCADCHGGDPKEDTANLSMSPDRGFKVRVTRQGTPDYCGRCHSDAAYMGKFNPQLRVDQLALYRTSVHAKQLAAGHKGAAECVDCHSVHNIRAGSDPLSPASPQHVTDTCAKCHTAAADLFRKSPHARFTSQRRPGCVACHASHATAPAGPAMLTGSTSVCARCHNATSAGGKAAAEIAQFLAGLEAAGPGSSDALARARLAVHSFDVAAIKRAAEPPAPATDAAPKSP